MKSTLHRAFVIGSTALILLSGCVVSKKKYEASQAELAKVRTDSTQLSQQVASLNGNVKDLSDRNSTLQRSLDSNSSQVATQQKSLDNYRNYFKEQQDTLAQVNQDVQSVLSQAGITNGDVGQMNDAIYVRLDENDVFKKNSTMVTAVGQKVLDGIAQVVNNRTDANVSVGAGDSAVGWASTGNMPGNGTTSEAPAPRHHRAYVSHAAASSGTAGTAAVGTSPVQKKVHHHYSSEGSVAFSSGPGHHPGWSLKQGRMVAVANHFLKNGVPKVNVSLQRPPMNGTPGSAIKIVIRPSRREFTPKNSSAMAGTDRQ